MTTLMDYLGWKIGEITLLLDLSVDLSMVLGTFNHGIIQDCMAESDVYSGCTHSWKVNLRKWYWRLLLHSMAFGFEVP